MIRMYPPDKEGRLLAAFRFHARYFSLAAEIQVQPLVALLNMSRTYGLSDTSGW